MDINPTHIATASVALIAPFMPYLTEVAKASGTKFAEAIAEKGGEGAWGKALKIWSKLKERFSQNGDLEDAARMLARKPEDESRRVLLTEVIAEILKSDPDFAENLLDVFGGTGALQTVIANSGSWVQDVKQDMTGDGQQRLEVNDSTAINITQTQRRQTPLDSKGDT